MTRRKGLREVAGKPLVCSECGRKPKRQPKRVDKRFQIRGEQWWCYGPEADTVHCQACCSCVGWGPP